MNKNVNTGAVIRAKPCSLQIEPSVYKLLANYQTGGYKFRPMSGWNGTVGSRSAFQFITHSLIKSLNALKHDD